MNQKRLISLLISGLMIFSIAAIANADVVTLKAEVPDGSTLKAFKITLTETANVTDVKAVAGTGFAVTPNKMEKTVIVNGFSVDGLKGPAELAIIDITVDGAANFGVTVDDFGESAEKKICPVKVTVGNSVTTFPCEK